MKNPWVKKQLIREGERLEAAAELIRKAQSEDNGLAYIDALRTVPQGVLDSDEQYDLRREWILGRLDHHQAPTFGPLIIDVPDTHDIHPMRRDGQVHSFNALPYPGQRRYTKNMWLVRNNGRPR